MNGFKRPELTKSISSYFAPPERIPGVLSTPGMLWKILMCLAEQESTDPLYCLIDGLDECDDISTRWLAAKFIKYAKDGIRGSLHIIIVSRDIPAFRYVRSISLDPNDDAKVSDDVEKFTSTKMAELSHLLGFTEEFNSQIQGELLQRAGGTFL